MSGGATPLMALGASDWLAIGALAVSVVSPVLTKLYLDRRVYREQLRADYEHEQRKALHSLVAKHHGLLLEHATSWHYRMINIYANVGRRVALDWLAFDGRWPEAPYYFKSTVYRFLALVAGAKRFEDEQIYIDARVAEADELDFVKFVKAFHWVLSDVSLFQVEGVDYDEDAGPDHFFSDDLRTVGECTLVDGRVPTYRTFVRRLRRTSATDELAHVLQFFDRLNPDEDRLRWDRLVCLHLITISFLNRFGYGWQRPGDEGLRHACAQLRHPGVGRNLARWLPRLGLDGTPAGEEIARALASLDAKGTAPPPSV
jgi:hypothetical protein